MDFRVTPLNIIYRITRFIHQSISVGPYATFHRPYSVASLDQFLWGEGEGTYSIYIYTTVKNFYDPTLKLLEIILFLFEFKTYFCYILGIG